MLRTKSNTSYLFAQPSEKPGICMVNRNKFGVNTLEKNVKLTQNPIRVTIA
jgi:hypothetical protein